MNRDVLIAVIRSVVMANTNIMIGRQLDANKLVLDASALTILAIAANSLDAPPATDPTWSNAFKTISPCFPLTLNIPDTTDPIVLNMLGRITGRRDILRGLFD